MKGDRQWKEVRTRLEYTAGIIGQKIHNGYFIRAIMK